MGVDFTEKERELLEYGVKLTEENEYQRSTKQFETEGKERVNSNCNYRKKHYSMV